jgi:hypothetical protein
MTPAKEQWPNCRIDHVLEFSQRRRVSAHVFEKSKLASGTEHTIQLAKGGVWIADRAEHQGGDGSVKSSLYGINSLRQSAYNLDRHAGECGVAPGSVPEIRLRLNRDDPGYFGRIMTEVQTVTSANLDDPSTEPRQEPPPIVGNLSVHRQAQARVHPRKDRMPHA